MPSHVEETHQFILGHGASAALRDRLRPILMTSFAFVMGVLPMARATGAGAYSRNSLGIVIAFGIAVSTVLGRFVIPIYYVLGERLIDRFARSRGKADHPDSAGDDHSVNGPLSPRGHHSSDQAAQPVIEEEPIRI